MLAVTVFPSGTPSRVVFVKLRKRKNVREGYQLPELEDCSMRLSARFDPVVFLP